MLDLHEVVGADGISLFFIVVAHGTPHLLVLVEDTQFGVSLGKFTINLSELGLKEVDHAASEETAE